MKRNLALKIAASMLGIAFALGAPQGAMAAMTPTCTTISNSATTNFTVGGVPQTAVTSATATFQVGNKVNLSVVTTQVADVTVYPGITGAILNYQITNNGNAWQIYHLATAALANGAAGTFIGTDNFNATNPVIWIETAVGSGVYAAGTTTVSMSPGQMINAQIRSDISLAQVDQDISGHSLTATTWNADGLTVTTEADNPIQTGPAGATTCTNANGAYVVFADTVASTDSPAKDGKDSARDGYQVCAANLSVTKNNFVYSDPITGTIAGPYHPVTGAGCTTCPKAIPGAVILYTITVANNGAAACSNATSVSIADSLNTEIATNGSLAFNTQFTDAANSCGAANGIVVDGVCKTNTNGDGDATDFTANVVNATGLSVNFGTNKKIKFQTTIQ